MTYPNNSEKIRVGVIGAGFISQVTHLHALSRTSKCEIVAISDGRGALCREIANNFGIPNFYENFEDMLEKSHLNAVVVCVARPCLGAVVETVLKKHLPVLSEKPMAHNVQDAKKLVHLSTKNNTQYYLGFMRRYDAGVMLFKEKIQSLIADKRYGEIIHASMLDFCGEYAIKIPDHLRPFEKSKCRYPEWRTIPDGFPQEFSKDYEYSMNVLIHDINLLRFIFGDDLKAQSFQVKPGFSQTALFSTPDFCIALSAGRAKIGKWDQVLHVYFEKGRLSLFLPSPLAKQESGYIEELTDGKRYNHYSIDKTWSFENQMDLFLSGLRGTDRMSSSGEDSLKDIVVLENLWKVKRDNYDA